MTKTKKILISVGAFLLAIVVFLSVWYAGARYPDFNATAAYPIPGLGEKFVPQGMCRIDDANAWLISGYMADGQNSRIYLLNDDGSIVKYVTLGGIAEEYRTGHFGGVACSGKNIWVANEGSILYFTTDDLYSTANGEGLEILGQFFTNTGADFCYANDSLLVVGDFYREKSHEVTGHMYERPIDETVNHAYAVFYAIGNGYCGLASGGVPSFVMSIPDQVQGFCITQTDQIVLSTSYGLPSSKLLVYQNVISNISEQNIQFGGATVRLFALGNSNLKQTIKAPAMSEGLDYVDGKVFVLFESACSKYRLVNRTRTKSVMSFELA